MIMVIMRAAMMSSIWIVMQDTQDKEVTSQSKYTRYQHILGFLNFILLYHSKGRLNEKFNCNNVNESNIEQST